MKKFETVPYDEDYKAEISSCIFKKNGGPGKTLRVERMGGFQHGTMILHCLKKWNTDPTEVDIIASHGQTIFHAPKSLHGNSKFGNATLQISEILWHVLAALLRSVTSDKNILPPVVKERHWLPMATF